MKSKSHKVRRVHNRSSSSPVEKMNEFVQERSVSNLSSHSGALDINKSDAIIELEKSIKISKRRQKSLYHLLHCVQ